MPTKDNLFRRDRKDNLFRHGIISHEPQLCLSGFCNVEIANHLFLTCNIFSSLWHLVRNWLHFSSVDPFGISNHFLHFAYSASVSKAQQSLI